MKATLAKIPKTGEVRYRSDRTALTCMAYADGYVMARQRACYPQLLTVRAWNELFLK